MASKIFNIGTKIIKKRINYDIVFTIITDLKESKSFKRYYLD
jgi:hypothetical protein